MGYVGRFDGDLAQRDERDRIVEELARAHGMDVRQAAELFADAERAARQDPAGQSELYWFKRLAGVSTAASGPAPGRRTAVEVVYGGYSARDPESGDARLSAPASAPEPWRSLPRCPEESGARPSRSRSRAGFARP